MTRDVRMLGHTAMLPGSSRSREFTAQGDFVPRSAAWGRQREPDLVQSAAWGEAALSSARQMENLSVLHTQARLHWGPRQLC